MCITMPIMPLCALTVKPCMKQTTTVSSSPASGPYAKAQMRIGISAGSYSRNAAAGISGKCITATSTMEIAPSIAIETSCLVEILLFFCSIFSFSLSTLSLPVLIPHISTLLYCTQSPFFNLCTKILLTKKSDVMCKNKKRDEINHLSKLQQKNYSVILLIICCICSIFLSISATRAN